MEKYLKALTEAVAVISAAGGDQGNNFVYKKDLADLIKRMETFQDKAKITADSEKLSSTGWYSEGVAWGIGFVLENLGGIMEDE